jgi:hypothetical protein
MGISPIVEKQVPSLGLILPNLLRRSREGTLDVPEELASEDVGREPAAVQDYERPLLPATSALVDRVGENLLAHSRLALKQNRDVQIPEHPSLLDRLTQSRSAADDGGKRPGGHGGGRAGFASAGAAGGRRSADVAGPGKGDDRADGLATIHDGLYPLGA